MKPGILASVILLGSTGLVHAEDVCMPAPEMEASLIDWYGETPVGDVQAAGPRMWASDSTGSWTLVQYLPDGNACVVDQGKDWTPDRNGDLLLAAISD